VTVLQSIAGVRERSRFDKQKGQEAAVKFKWAVVRGLWRRISAGSRRWFDESIRLRGQAEAVYICDDEDGKR
jgi:hypothetical protein